MVTAAAAGADYVEVDLRVLGDGTLVCAHNAQVRGVGELSRLTRAELGASAAPGPAAVTEFAAVLAALAGGDTALHLDVKDPGAAGPALVAAAAALGPGRSFLTCGDPALVAALRARCPTERVWLTRGAPRSVRWRDAVRRAVGALPGVAQPPDGLAVGSPAAARALLAAAADCGAGGLAVHRAWASRDLLEGCRDRGLDVAVWTVNDDAGMRALLTDSVGLGARCVLVTDRSTAALTLRALP